MESLIWRVSTEKIGSLESFLMNNPAVIGCTIYNARIETPTLVRQQVSTKTESGLGRIDLLGINCENDNFELRIFELKNEKVNLGSVEQTKNYLDGWREGNSAKKVIREWALGLKIEDLDENNIDEIIEKPKGILVAVKFEPEAITECNKLGIGGVRLARFRSGSRPEYYVVVEDQVGNIVQNLQGTRKRIGWQPYIDHKLIEPDDLFFIKAKDESDEVFMAPDPESFGSPSKRVRFTQESRSKILNKWPENKDFIEQMINKWKLKWVTKAFQQLRDNHGILISHATGIVRFTIDHSVDYANPGSHWRHLKTSRLLNDLKYQLYELMPYS